DSGQISDRRRLVPISPEQVGGGAEGLLTIKRPRPPASTACRRGLERHFACFLHRSLNISIESPTPVPKLLCINRCINGRKTMTDLTGKRARVTGGSRGIGAAIAQALADNGADVAFTYQNSAARAEAVKNGIEGRGRKAVAIQADS